MVWFSLVQFGSVWFGLVCSEAGAVLGSRCVCHYCERRKYSPRWGCERVRSWVYNKPASPSVRATRFTHQQDASGFKPQAGLFRTTGKRLFFLKHTKFSLQIVVCGLLVNIALAELPCSLEHLDFALLTSEFYYR